MSTMILSGVQKSYGGTAVLKDFSLTVEDGEFVTLFGPGGSGKTTVLRLLAGLEHADGGRLQMDGRVVDDACDSVFVSGADRKIGMVFESGALWPHMTVYNNIAFGLQLKKTDKQEVKRRVSETLQNLQIEHLADCPAAKLTRLEAQRAALARALVGGARTILIDGLPPNMGRDQRVELRGDLKRLHRDMGLTILLASQDQEEALTLSTRVAVLDQGRVIQADSPIDLYQNPCSLTVARKIGTPKINLIPAKAQVAMGLMTVQSVLGIHQFGASAFTADTREEPLFDCLVGVRPEQIVIDTQPTADSVRVKVYSCQPSGSETIVQLLADGQVLLAKCLGLRLFRPDQTVFLTIPADCITVFHQGTQRLIKTAALPIPDEGTQQRPSGRV